MTRLVFVYALVFPPTVPGAPPRRVEVDVLNSTALKVMWRSLAPGRQHGQIRGYQVHYVRVENGESRGLPLIKDVMLADAQVRTAAVERTLPTYRSISGARR